MKKLLISLLFILNTANLFAQSCNDITSSYDKFMESTTFSSPGLKIGKVRLGDVKSTDITIKMEVLDSDTIYFLSFLGATSNYNLLAEGVIILLEGAPKINFRNVKFNLIQTSNVADIYMCKINLTLETVEIFKNHSITDVRLFAYNSLGSDDFEIPKNIRSKLKYYFNCLSSSG